MKYGTVTHTPPPHTHKFILIVNNRKFKSENHFTHVAYIIVVNFQIPHFVQFWVVFFFFFLVFFFFFFGFLFCFVLFCFVLFFFFVKSRSFTQRLVSQENAFKKNQDPVPFRKTIGSNDPFTLIKKQFEVFKIAKFEFKVTVHYSL